MHYRVVPLIGTSTLFYVPALATIALKIWSSHIKEVCFQLFDGVSIVDVIIGTGGFDMCWVTQARHTIIAFLLIIILTLS
jgi:hypothetical protein